MLTEPKKFSAEEVEDKLFAKQNNLVSRLAAILKRNGWTRKALADAMDVHESSLSRMLTEDSNLTLKSVVQMEISSGEELLCTPQEFEFKFFDNRKYRDELIDRAWHYDEKRGIHYEAFTFRIAPSAVRPSTRYGEPRTMHYIERHITLAARSHLGYTPYKASQHLEALV